MSTPGSIFVSGNGLGRILTNSLALALLAAMVSAAAGAAPGALTGESDTTVGRALGHCLLFGLLGITMVVVGFKVFDWLIRKIDIEQEVAKGNIAAAILGAAVVLGISIIVAAAIH